MAGTSTGGEQARAATPDARVGQSLVEFAVFLPILLIMLAGFIEIGVYANTYLTVIDASREGARFGNNLDPDLTLREPFDTRVGYDPFPEIRPSYTIVPGQPTVTATLQALNTLRDVCDAGGTVNFYYAVACLTFQNLSASDQFRLVANGDIVVSVVGMAQDTVYSRWPLNPRHGSGSLVVYGDEVHLPNDDDHAYHYRGLGWEADNHANVTCTPDALSNCRCWSLFGRFGTAMDNQTVISRLVTGSPPTAMVVVEVYYFHPQFTRIFTIGDFLPDPIMMRPYTVFSVPAAEPDIEE